MSRGRIACTLALTALAVEVAPAGAQERGVIRDPDSPAGKEYALPFDSARRTGAGPGAAKEEGVAPLFGIGIRPPGSGSGGGGAAQGDPGSGRNGGSAGAGRRNGGLKLPSADDLDGGGTSGLTLAILAAVLLGGGLLGLALRAASRARPSSA